MMHHEHGLWRIEFRTDLTRADTLSLPLAYMLETHWSDGVRWLGMLFRTRLTTLELERVDIATWGELERLEAFMKGLFDEAWSALPAKNGSAEMPLGAAIVAAKYPVQSALHFAPAVKKATLRDNDPVKSFPVLYAQLLGLRDQLTPALTAPVVRLPARRRVVPVARPDLEIANRAA